MLMYNLLPDDYGDYGIPEPVGTAPTGGLVLDAILEPQNEATRQIVAAALRCQGLYDGQVVIQANAENLASLATAAIRERTGLDYEVGGYCGAALIGTVPCQGRGENPLLASALETELRKRGVRPVYAVFQDKGGGEAGVFMGFAEAYDAARGTA